MVNSHVAPSRGTDAVSVLTCYLLLLLAIPAPMVLQPLGTAGSPATIIGLGAFCLWLWFHIQREQPIYTGRQPVRDALLLWLIVMLAVYAHAMSQPIPSDEISPADSGILRLMAMAGVLLTANDGVPTMDRYRIISKRLLLGVACVSLLGIIQALTGELWIDRISIPGLTPGAAGWELAGRSGLARPSGTATHPIEFGMVLTMVLPLAMAFARSAPQRRWLYRVLLCAIGIAILLAISRSAIICAAVSVVLMAAGWPLAAKFRTLAVVVVIAAFVFLTMPGVLGTITNLFTGINNDASVQSRTGSYDIAWDFIYRNLALGRGFGTFLPKYWILDNGYLGLLIEGGVLGLAALLILILTSIVIGRRAARNAAEAFDREVTRAVVIGIIAGATGLAFFDTFGFPQSAGVFFLLVGMAGASWRLTCANDDRHDRVVTRAKSRPPTSTTF